ncbi:AraC family transcriptional regulator [Streptomyces sp. SID13726]|uniref:AraC family transcriptional regulator n=1 Tax=Streptomyces sp. SID13726 TaxID=2706058 RepID=UPI0013BCBFA0|nr:AraC family transcriptional regulator [Streptomyces sp. SID13726]NEB04495.1 AraC family transcriptional regulator [Streptomyces sp. SID13726]
MDSRHAYQASNLHADEATEKGRREYWAHYAETHVLRAHHTYVDPQPCRVRAVRQQSDRYSLHAFHIEGEKEIRRTALDCKRHPDDDYRLIVVTKGEPLLVRQGEAEAVISPGMAAMATPAEPFEIRHGAHSAFVLQLPNREINERINSKSPLALGFDTSKGLGRLTVDMLRGLCEQRDNLTELEFNAVCDRLADLLCMLMVGDDSPDPGHLREIDSAIRRYVHEHAGDRTLSLPAVAAALGWSPRRLQEVMAQAGTTYRDLVREERLTAARRMLRDSAGRPIGEVAARCGFASANVLSMLFRERYGESPRDYRHRVGVGVAVGVRS